jgi:hypothetical protein
MAPQTNPIDITTLLAVKSWAGFQNPPAPSGDDQLVQDAITAFSAWALKYCGRGPADGSIPAASPFVTIVNYDEFYDGNGNDRLALRNWPIGTPTLVNANGITVQQSTSVTTPGWVVDQSKKFLVLRGGGTSRYGRGRGYRGSLYNSCGWPLGTQNIEVAYPAGFSSLPADLEITARKIVSLAIQSRKAIGQKSQAMGQGAGTTVWDWTINESDREVLNYYKARVA